MKPYYKDEVDLDDWSADRSAAAHEAGDHEGPREACSEPECAGWNDQ